MKGRWVWVTCHLLYFKKIVIAITLGLVLTLCRGLDRLDLPDQENVISLYEGHVTGLTNLSRCGDACLEAATDNFTLTFALQAKDITAIYGWKKRRLK